MIVAENLTKKYGSRAAVDHISFRVPKGEVVGFLGPNGAGKSTTLKMVSGFLPPSEGTITVAGFDVVEDSMEARKRLGYMPESTPLYPEMRVEEYLAFRAEIKGVTRGRKDAVAHAMAQADITDVARQLIGELSKGYRQRVGLADALVADPELLILDEPTAGLDPNQILQVRELIKTLGKSRTIFLSTHILSEVEAVCSRVVILAKGRVVAEGSPDEIRARLTSQRERTATLVVRGAAERARTVVAAVDGLRLLGEPTRLDGTDDDAVMRFALEVNDDGGRADTVTEALVSACVAAKLGVRGLEVTSKSLESIFHDLTSGEPATSTDVPAAAAETPTKTARAKASRKAGKESAP